jgi:hypothetical protein
MRFSCRFWILAVATLGFVLHSGVPAESAAPATSPTSSAAPRALNRADIVQLICLVDHVAPPERVLTHLAIVGNDALIYWLRDSIGGVVLAYRESGSWSMVAHDHGAYSVTDLLRLVHAMGLPTARKLVSQALLPWPKSRP